MLNCVIILATICLLVASPVAQAEPGESLKGVNGVFLFTLVDKDLSDAGVDRDAIETSVELKLRSIGLTVITAKHPGAATQKLSIVALMIGVKGMKITDTEMYCYSASMAASEGGILHHLPKEYIPITTWTDDVIGCVGKHRLDAIKGTVEEIADTFCNDYLIANPKPSSIPGPSPVKP